MNVFVSTNTRASAPALSPPAAGHIVEQEQLASYLDAALSTGPRNVVLFLQDKVKEGSQVGFCQSFVGCCCQLTVCVCVLCV